MSRRSSPAVLNGTRSSGRRSLLKAVLTNSIQHDESARSSNASSKNNTAVGIDNALHIYRQSQMDTPRAVLRDFKQSSNPGVVYADAAFDEAKKDETGRRRSLRAAKKRVDNIENTPLAYTEDDNDDSEVGATPLENWKKKNLVRKSRAAAKNHARRRATLDDDDVDQQKNDDQFSDDSFVGQVEPEPRKNGLVRKRRKPDKTARNGDSGHSERRRQSAESAESDDVSEVVFRENPLKRAAATGKPANRSTDVSDVEKSAAFPEEHLVNNRLRRRAKPKPATVVNEKQILEDDNMVEEPSASSECDVELARSFGKNKLSRNARVKVSNKSLLNELGKVHRRLSSNTDESDSIRRVAVSPRNVVEVEADMSFNPNIESTRVGPNFFNEAASNAGSVFSAKNKSGVLISDSPRASRASPRLSGLDNNDRGNGVGSHVEVPESAQKSRVGRRSKLNDVSQEVVGMTRNAKNLSTYRIVDASNVDVGAGSVASATKNVTSTPKSASAGVGRLEVTLEDQAGDVESEGNVDASRRLSQTLMPPPPAPGANFKLANQTSPLDSFVIEVLGKGGENVTENFPPENGPKTSARSRKKSRNAEELTILPKDEVIFDFERFSGMRVTRDAVPQLMEIYREFSGQAMSRLRHYVRASGRSKACLADVRKLFVDHGFVPDEDFKNCHLYASLREAFNDDFVLDQLIPFTLFDGKTPGGVATLPKDLWHREPSEPESDDELDVPRKRGKRQCIVAKSIKKKR